MKNIKNYINTKTAIECATPEQFEAITIALENQGYALDTSAWHQYKEQTGISVIDNTYERAEHFIKNGYIILPASEFLEDKEIVGYEWNELAKSNEGSIIEMFPKWTLNFNDIILNKGFIKILSGLGVLDIWTTPVYAEKPKYKKGEWYYGWCSDNKQSFIIKAEHQKGDQIWNNICVWDDGTVNTANGFILEELIKGKATTDQLITHLKAAAKLKGYKEGVRTKCNCDECKAAKSTHIIRVLEDGFVMKDDGLYCAIEGSNVPVLIFSLTTCEWATILPELTLESLAKRVLALEQLANTPQAFLS